MGSSTASLGPAAGRRGALWRRLPAPAAVGLALVAATGYVAVVDPHRPGHYPTCFFLGATGLYCPGCGGLRAVHDLTQGNLLGALDMNAFVTVLVVVSGLLWLWWAVAAVRPVRLSTRVVAAPLFGLLAVLPVFAVVRNLPVGQVLAP